MATGMGGTCCRAANGGGLNGLVFGRITGKHLSHFKQRHIGKATIGIALRCFDQAGQQAWTHVGEIRCNGIGQCQRGGPATE